MVSERIHEIHPRDGNSGRVVDQRETERDGENLHSESRAVL